MRCVLDEGHVGRAMANGKDPKALVGTGDWACHLDQTPVDEDTRVAPGSVVWWDHQELGEHDCTCPPRSDTSIRDDQLAGLADADPRIVAATLAAVLTGRLVRAERPYTPEEIVVYGPQDGPYGAQLQVVDVAVTRDGGVVLHGDDGVELRVDHPEQFTWWVFSEEHPLMAVTMPPTMTKDEAERVLGLLPDSHVLLSGHEMQVRRIEPVQIPRPGDQIERWLASVDPQFFTGSEMLDHLLDDHREHARLHVRLDQPLSEESAPAPPPLEPERSASPAPDGTNEPAESDAISEIALTAFEPEHLEWTVTGPGPADRILPSMAKRLMAPEQMLSMRLVDDLTWIVRLNLSASP